MADTWGEFVYGDPDRKHKAIIDQQRQWDEAKSSKLWRGLQSMAAHGDPEIDPREILYRLPAAKDQTVADLLSPPTPKPSEFEAAGQWAMQKAWEYPTEMGMRLRDTGVRTIQEAAAGNLGSAALMAGRTALAGPIPYAAAGTPGSPDDWRDDARKAGWSEGGILAADIGTDPEMWLTAPVSGPAAFVVPALPFAAARVAKRGITRADDVLRSVGRAADAARYGRGIRTEVVDPHGRIIRRLQNTSADPVPHLGLPIYGNP